MPLDIESVRSRLPGRRIEWFRVLGSTMPDAERLAQQGCPAGTAVVAEEQTAGQGRHGHSWHSEPGAGLYVSIVLRPGLGPDSLPALTLALGLAAAEAVARTTDLRPDLRWPNDVLLSGKKTAGVLVQVSPSFAVAGIGVNVNHASFPADLAGIATSLRIESGHPQSREDLLVSLLQCAGSFCRMLVEGGRQLILEAFARASSYARGKRVCVEQSGSTIEGITAGLDPSGFLKVRDMNGTEHLILAGGVRAVSAGRG